MKTSDYLKLFAIANKRAGHDKYAEILNNQAAVYEAEEILKEKSNGERT